MFGININKIYISVIESIEIYSPKIIGAILILWIWTIIAVWIHRGVIYIFKRFEIIDLINKLNLNLPNQKTTRVSKSTILRKKIRDKIKIDEVVAKCFSYYIFLAFFRISITIIWIREIEKFLSELLEYLPSLFIWVIIWFFGIRFANFIYDVVYHALNLTKQKTAKIIASWAKTIILFFTLMVVLSKIWIDIEITNTILIWFISMLAIAWWLAFWLWWKDIAHEVLESFRK